MKQTQFLFSEISEAQVKGLTDLDPGLFVPNPGTLLIVLLPEITKEGSIHLPEQMHHHPSLGRVAAIPPWDAQGKKEAWVVDSDEGLPVAIEGCLYQPGDIVVFNPGSGIPVPFGNRKDLLLVQYSNGPESDILGKIPAAALSVLDT